MPSKTHPVTGPALRAARHAANLNVAEVGVAIGVDTHTVYRWEQGRNRPDVGTLERLAKLYGVTFTIRPTDKEQEDG